MYEKLCEYFHCSDPNNADLEDKLVTDDMSTSTVVSYLKGVNL